MSFIEKNVRWLFVAGILLIAVATLSSVVRRQPIIVIVSLDGARGDRVRSEHLPAIHDLAREGSFTYTARTVLPSRTVSAHASMLTGVSVERHGASWDEWTGQRMQTLTLFDFFADRGRRSIALFGKEKMKTVQPQRAQWTAEVIDGGSRAVWSRAHEILAREPPDALFIHLTGPDRAGHQFGDRSSEYRAAILEADEIVGELRALLTKRALNDRTVLLVTSDHGIRGHSHGGSTQEEMTIPWIVSGPGIRRGHHIETSVSIMDTAPTLAALIGSRPPGAIDGKVISEIFEEESLWKSFVSWLTSPTQKSEQKKK